MSIINNVSSVVSKFFVSVCNLICGKRATLGLVRVSNGDNHQMQLWIFGSAAGYRYEVRNAFVPGGKMVRSCVLDSGSSQAKRKIALRDGNASMDRLLK